MLTYLRAGRKLNTDTLITVNSFWLRSSQTRRVRLARVRKSRDASLLLERSRTSSLGIGWNNSGYRYGRLLLLKARIGDWLCAHNLSKIHKSTDVCPNCAAPKADLQHDLLFCPEFESNRDDLIESLKRIWNKKRFNAWMNYSSYDIKLAELLGLVGQFKQSHAEAIKSMLFVIYSHNKSRLAE